MDDFKLPYSILPPKILKSVSSSFTGIGESLENFFPFLKISLKQAKIKISAKEYLSMCVTACGIFFMYSFIVIMIVLAGAQIENFIWFSIAAGVFMTLFAFMQQLAFPMMFVNRRVKSIEKNLMPALQNILVQLNSGVPLFDIMANISKGDYGEVSEEFSIAVKQINAGNSQVETLENIAATNPSLFFRRAVWQLVNGMKSGSDMSLVIDEIINLLSEEQILQIQRYGAQLNPLAMFYMLAVVIMPSLGTTFLIMLSSFVSMPAIVTKSVFWGVYGMVFFFQLMFMGAIKSKRPNLLGD